MLLLISGTFQLGQGLELDKYTQRRENFSIMKTRKETVKVRLLRSDSDGGKEASSHKSCKGG